MADEQQAAPSDPNAPKSGLEWVTEPYIYDGTVIYKYRNSGAAAATFVGESVNVFCAGTSSAQMFQINGMQPGQEQETHAPLTEVGNGEASVHVTIQSSSGGSDWDATIEVDVKGKGVNGTLYAEGAQPVDAFLEIDVRDLHKDGNDLMFTYRVTGPGELKMVSAFTTLTHDGQSRWSEAVIMEVDREDICRVPIPFDLVDSEGWRLLLSIGAVVDNDNGTNALVHIDLEHGNDGVTLGSYAIETDAH